MRENVSVALVDTATGSLVTGMGETFFPAFILAMGLGEIASGLIVTLPLVAGALLQLSSPLMVRTTGTFSRWIGLCYGVQIATFFAFALSAWFGALLLTLAFLLSSFYWAATMALSSTWNTWLPALLPRRGETLLLTQRNRVAPLFHLGGFLAAGVLLQVAGKAASATQTAFAILFAVTALSRWSALRKLKHAREIVPATSLPAPRDTALWELFHPRSPRGGRVLLYMLAVQACANISGPFATAFLLHGLSFGYWSYAVLTAIPYITRILFAPLFAQIARSRGPSFLIRLAGFGIIPLPALWIISTDFKFLFFVQIASGFFWGAYDLATIFLIFRNIREEERIRLLTQYNFWNAIFISFASLLGASLIDLWGGSSVAYLAVFGLSSVLRIATLPLVRRLQEHESIRTQRIFSLRALRGWVFSLRASPSSLLTINPAGLWRTTLGRRRRRRTVLRRRRTDWK